MSLNFDWPWQTLWGSSLPDRRRFCRRRSWWHWSDRRVQRPHLSLHLLSSPENKRQRTLRNMYITYSILLNYWIVYVGWKAPEPEAKLTSIIPFIKRCNLNNFDNFGEQNLHHHNSKLWATYLSLRLVRSERGCAEFDDISEFGDGFDGLLSCPSKCFLIWRCTLHQLLRLLNKGLCRL